MPSPENEKSGITERGDEVVVTGSRPVVYARNTYMYTTGVEGNVEAWEGFDDETSQPQERRVDHPILSNLT